MRLVQQRVEARQARDNAQDEILAQLPNLAPNNFAALEAMFTMLEDGPINISYPDESCSVKEALASEESAQWLAALSEEFNSIKTMRVYKLVPQSAAAGRRVMKGKPVFVRKHNETGVTVRYKAQ